MLSIKRFPCHTKSCSLNTVSKKRNSDTFLQAHFIFQLRNGTKAVVEDSAASKVLQNIFLDFYNLALLSTNDHHLQELITITTRIKKFNT